MLVGVDYIVVCWLKNTSLYWFPEWVNVYLYIYLSPDNTNFAVEPA